MHPDDALMTSIPASPPPSRLRALLASHRLAVASRAVAAIGGGYVLAACSNALLAVALPMARSQAVLTSMLVAIVVYAAAAMWAFATATAARAWIGITLPALACYGGYRLLAGGVA